MAVRASLSTISASVLRVPRPLVLVGGVLLVLVAIGAVAMALFKPADAANGTARVGSPAPQVALPVLDSGLSDLKADRGKVVLLNFWATWCEPCKSEMPALQALARDLRDEPFRLYSIDLQEDAQQVQSFQTQYDLHLFVLLDQNGEVTRAYGVRALPASFLIDKSGVLRQQRLGQLAIGGQETAWSADWLGAQVRTLLAAS